MADVFISYSQRHPEPTVALAAALVDRGYDPYYDVNLLPGQIFGQVIDAEIDKSRAVVTIWSAGALASTWVRAESERAFNQKKLICARTEDVHPNALPTPFGQLHTVLVTDIESIVASLLAKGIRPSGASADLLPDEHRILAEAAANWRLVKASDDPEMLLEFLELYRPAVLYRRLAEKRLKELQVSGRSEGATTVVAALPSQAPPVVAVPAAASADDVVLRIDPGMHTAMINRISLSADGRVLATGSDDKTVRLWALPGGRLIRTLRPAVGAGNDGKVYAVALAPDASWVAAGGWDATWSPNEQMFVTIFDTATGAITARLGPLPSVIDDLEVSPDGRRLAAGLGGSNGIRVWEWVHLLPASAAQRGEGTHWRLAFEDTDYGGGVYGLAFARDGRLWTTSEDGHVRLYGPDGRRRAKAKAPGGEPSGVAVSPEGTRIAVGYDDSMRVDVLDAATLALLFAADTSGITDGNLGRVAWLSDGRLAAAGLHESVFTWADAGRGARTVWPGPGNMVTDLTAVPASLGGGVAFGAGDPAFGLVGADGTRVLFRGSPLADLRGKRLEHFLVSQDGRRVRFGLDEWSRAPYLLDLGELRLVASPTSPAGLLQADTTSLAVEGWINTTAPKLAGKPLQLQTYEMSRSLAVAPDAASFILGADWRLRRFDAAGTELWQKAVPGAVWGVNLARGGRLVIAAYGDGTIRWLRASDGEELLAFFVHVDRESGAPVAKAWVLWTPKGHYTCSPGGDDLIGWHVNRGPDQAADFYPAETFATFRRPDLVAQALDGV